MLSSSVEAFLGSVYRAAVLEERYSKLSSAGITLFIKLVRADAVEQSDVYERTARKLEWVRAARRKLADELAFVRSSAGLQVLGCSRPFAD